MINTHQEGKSSKSKPSGETRGVKAPILGPGGIAEGLSGAPTGSKTTFMVHQPRTQHVLG